MPGKTLAALACLSLLAAPAAAQSVIGRAMDEFAPRESIIVGGGVGLAIQPYRDLDNEAIVFPVPFWNYQSRRFAIVGKTARFRLIERDNVEFAAIADLRAQNYDADDSPFLRGMEGRDATLELGGRLSARAGQFALDVAAQADALSRHGGYEINAKLSRELSGWRPLSIRPHVGFRYQSSSLADYYYGVDRDEALVETAPPPGATLAINRPAYGTGDAVIPFAGVSGHQAFSERVAIYGSASWDFLPSSITDSPIVADEGAATFLLGVVYVFGGD